MAFKHLDLTLPSGSATRLTSTHIPARQVRIFNLTGNGALSVGGPTIAAASFGTQIAAGGIYDLGPFSGEMPVNLEDIYFIGTSGNVIHVAYVT